jgi:hypothetical protein
MLTDYTARFSDFKMRRAAYFVYFPSPVKTEQLKVLSIKIYIKTIILHLRKKKFATLVCSRLFSIFRTFQKQLSVARLKNSGICESS